jgi:hypothetical protein
MPRRAAARLRSVRPAGPARRASSAPPIRPGKPKKFSIIAVYDAWPPGTSRSNTIVDSRPTRVDGGGEARRAGADHGEVVVRLLRRPQPPHAVATDSTVAPV